MTLTRVTVNLVPGAMEALEHAVATTGESKTDAINRAVRAYDWLVRVLAEDGGELVLQRKDGTAERVRFL